MKRVFLSRRTGQRFLSIFLILTLFVGCLAYGKELNDTLKLVESKVKNVVLSELFEMAEWSETSLIGLFAVSLPLWEEASTEPFLREETEDNSKRWSASFAPDTYLFGALPLLGQMPKPKVDIRVEEPISRGAEGDRTNPPLVAVAEPDAGPEEVLDTELPQANSLRQEDQPSDLVPEEKGASVVIYNTHNAETYSLTDGVDHIYGGQGGVVSVAETIEKTLINSYGIPTVRSSNIHDDNWLTANPYSKSAKTLKGLLETNPGTQMVIDVHRDSKIGRENSKVEINGKSYAKIMLVVGTGERAAHPEWERNKALADEIGNRLEAKYPGIFRRVLTKPGRYNQHMHPGAVLVEIGSTDNSLEEAQRSAEAFASIIGEILAENRD